MAVVPKQISRWPQRIHRAAALLLLLGAITAHSPTQAAETTVTIGLVGKGSSVDWPLYIGVHKGFFAERGIKLDFISAPSSASVQQWLAAGSTMIGAGGMADPVRAIDKGAQVALLRTEAEVAPYALLSKASIKTPADLRGKTVSVGGSADITRVYFERIVGPAGLKRGDYDLIYAGATSARYAALKSGAADAAILNPPFIFKAGGLNNLGLVADSVKDFPFTGYGVNLAWGRGHKTELKNFLAALTRSVDWFYDPANRKEAIDILTNEAGADRADVEQTYDFFHKIHIFDRVGKVDEQKIGKLITALKTLGDVDNSNPARFLDPELSHLTDASN